ncbi:MAG: hypothetical protein GF349_02285 [Candidatus Magasanikbacteria bacterium]|nr:hypothetical protein [Candidatus Magasanikbacteria bacterium]
MFHRLKYNIKIPLIISIFCTAMYTLLGYLLYNINVVQVLGSSNIKPIDNAHFLNIFFLEIKIHFHQLIFFPYRLSDGLCGIYTWIGFIGALIYCLTVSTIILTLLINKIKGALVYSFILLFVSIWFSTSATSNILPKLCCLNHSDSYPETYIDLSTMITILGSQESGLPFNTDYSSIQNLKPYESITRGSIFPWNEKYFSEIARFYCRGKN